MNKIGMKRTLSLLLALIMVMQLSPVFAYAAEPAEGEQEAAVAEEASPAPEEEPAPETSESGEASTVAEDASQETAATQEDAEPAAEPDTEPVQEPEEQPVQEPEAEIVQEQNDLPVEEAADTEKAAEDGAQPVGEALNEDQSPEIAEAVSPEAVEDVPAEEEAAPAEEELDEEELRQKAIMEEMDARLLEIKSQPRRALASYESELAGFPASYQPALKALHQKHPNWVFVAVNTGLDWNQAVAGEYGDRSTMEYNEGPGNLASDLLLNNRDGYYSASGYSDTNHYKPVDGRFVSASRAAIAYYMDPRNFLTENFIFMFESDTYSGTVDLEGVTAILRSGCNTSAGMANITTYTTTKGKTANLSDLSSLYGSTYPEIIYNIGVLTDVSPYFISSKIVQETSANTNSKVISGTVDGYTGYYNFFNIGAYASASGNAYINGLKYAKNHDWFNPIRALEGGVNFLADKYIKQGQDTAYYMRFNVSPNHTYSTYTHQYMSATAAAAGEGSSTFKGYQKAGALDSSFVFYIPVYNNMPDQTSTVALTPATTGKTTINEILYSGPAAQTTKLVTVPKGSTVTVLGGTITSSESYLNRLYYPYWYQVKVKVSGKEYSGYIHEQSVSLNAAYNIKPNSTKNIAGVTSISGSSGTIYYETSDPSVATVTATTGLIKAVGSGTCTIYAISGAGSFDAIGLTVSSKGSVCSDKDTSGPVINAASTGSNNGNTTGGSSIVPVLKAIDSADSGVRLTWNPVSGAASYNVYRKTGSSNWSLLDTVTSASYTDTSASYGQQYTYTVRATINGKLTGYDHTGKTILYLETPILSDADASSKGIKVSWFRVSGAAGYNVYRKTSNSKWSLIATVQGGEKVSYSDSAFLVSGTRYLYTVRAFKGTSRSYFDRDGIAAYAEASTFATPVLKSAASSASGITVSWGKVNGSQGYRVYRKTSTTKWALIGTTSSTSYTDTKTSSGEQYLYTVRAYYGKTLSGYDHKGISAAKFGTPALKSAKSGHYGITVNWSKVSGADGYYVFRKSGKSGWLKIKQIKGSTTSYTDKNANLAKDTKYTYTVRAYKGSVLSGYNASGVSAKATNGTGLAEPALKKAVNGVGGIKLTWAASKGAKKYNVYRKVPSGKWSRIATVSSVAYTDQNVQPGTTYLYTVRAVAGKKISSYNPKGVSAHYMPTPKLYSAVAGADGITVSWQEIDGATGYRLYRKVSGGKWAQIKRVTGTSYTDNSGLKKGTTYVYTVRAYDNSGLSYYRTSGVSAKAVANGAEALKQYVTTGMVNYRTGPGTSHALAGTMNEGTTVQVVSGSGVKVGTSTWYQFKLNNHYYYVSSKYLKAA